MKFGKEFRAQIIPEWQEAYMDYNKLKGILKDFIKFQQRQPQSPASATTAHGLKRRASLYRAFSGLRTLTRHNSGRVSAKVNEDEVILVGGAEEEDGEREQQQYQTMFLRSEDEGGEYELVFFRRLDDEFNKVNEFYKRKVEEVMAEADELSKQMNALISLRIKVDKPMVGEDSVSDHFSKSIHLVDGKKSGHWGQMEVIQEVEMSREEEMKRNNDEGAIEGGINDVNGVGPASFDQWRINVEPETPVSTLKCVLNFGPGQSFSKQELNKAEGLMMKAFSEFYRKLRFLKNFCFLNQLAFSKIMKKYDKITSRNASKAYLNMVDNSNLGSSSEITQLMERVEATFVKHFANGNREKGMDVLRPKHKRERHRITFCYGFFSGCSIALIVAIILLVHARDLIHSSGRNKYMENIFPLYSLYGFIVLHLIMYSGNIFFWKRYRVNYPFIFGFKQGTELGYREVLNVATGLAVLALAAAISNLEMDMDPRTKKFEALTELVPLGLLAIVLLITFCPFNILYRSSRFFLIRCTFHCLLAPFYKVTLPDFFLADQLTSQVQAIRSLQFYVCYYGWGDFRTRSNNCSQKDVFQVFYVVVAIIPYWFRFIQCIRRLVEEKDKMHALNGLKYFSTIIAVAMRTLYDFNKGTTWLILAAVSSGIATIGSTYWDIVIDWGLLRRNSRNHWLRDKLVIPNKSVYYVAMVLNVVLRLAWMQTVLGITDTPFLHRRALTALVASLEIIRRGIWSFFRLENEHLNNVGKYRAFKSVPLPFYYDDDDESKHM